MPNAAKCVMRVIFKDSPHGPADAAQAAFIILMAQHLPVAHHNAIVAVSTKQPELYVFDKHTAAEVAAMLHESEAPHEFGDPATVPPLDMAAAAASIQKASTELELSAQSEYEAAIRPSIN